MSKPWPYTKIAKQFHRENGRNPYTMVPNKTLELEMMDPRLSKEDRVKSAVRRYAWGNFSKWAVDAMPQIEPTDPTPHPITQEELARILGLSPGSVSKACAKLKDQDWLDKNNQFLFPKNGLSTSESTKDKKKGFDSGNYRSLFLRHQESYLKENPEAAKSLAENTAIHKQSGDAIKAINRAILAYHRDAERREAQQQTQQNQQKENVSENSHLPTRLCTPTHNVQTITGEEMEKFSFTNLTNVVLRLQEKSFTTPKNEFDPSKTLDPPNPNGSNETSNDSLKPLKSLSNGAGEVSQSVGADGLTDRQRAIMNAIPLELLEALQDTPTSKLLDRIDAKLGRAPLQEFTGRIRDRWLTITSLGILPSLAADVLRAWNKAQHDAEGGIPIKSEKRSALQEAMADVEAEYGS